MNKLKILSIATIVGLSLTTAVHAQSLEGKKVAYVDLSLLFDNYSKTKEYDAILEKKHSEYEDARNKKLDKIREAQNKLALLKDAEKAKLQEEMDKQRADLLEFDRQQQTDLKKQRDEKIREILLEIEKVVRTFAEKEKYAMIFNDRVLIYANKDMDITEKILKLLNEGSKDTGAKDEPKK